MEFTYKDNGIELAIIILPSIFLGALVLEVKSFLELRHCWSPSKHPL